MTFKDDGSHGDLDASMEKETSTDTQLSYVSKIKQSMPENVFMNYILQLPLSSIVCCF